MERHRSSTITAADVPATTVYFGAADGEQAAADAVGKVLEAPVAPRFPTSPISHRA